VLCLLLAALSSSAAEAAQADAPLMRPVNVWVDAFNSGQMTFPQDAFTDDCTVIDEFPPFTWSATRENVRHWYARLIGSDSAAHHARFLAAKEHLTLHSPRFERQPGDDAYLVFPATLRYRLRNERHAQRGTFVVVERKTAGGWRIAAHSWAIDEVHEG
jgi:ketosteroid isomerase-like protein